jgi:hypothetical protein
VEWGFKAPDVLTLLQHARDFPLRASPFVDAPRMRSAVWIEPRLRAEAAMPNCCWAAVGAVVARAPVAPSSPRRDARAGGAGVDGGRCEDDPALSLQPSSG